MNILSFISRYRVSLLYYIDHDVLTAAYSSSLPSFYFVAFFRQFLECKNWLGQNIIT